MNTEANLVKQIELEMFTSSDQCPAPRALHITTRLVAPMMLELVGRFGRGHVGSASAGPFWFQFTVSVNYYGLHNLQNDVRQNVHLDQRFPRNPTKKE